MASLQFEEEIIPSQVRKEVTCETVLSAGDKVKMELGEDELDEVVPANKQWELVANIRLIETDV